MATIIYESNGQAETYITPRDVDFAIENTYDGLDDWEVLPGCSRAGCPTIAMFVGPGNDPPRSCEHLCYEHGKDVVGVIRCLCEPSSAQEWM